MTDLLARLTTALADRYAVERELGGGGMATVYLAQDLKHERQVAIKVLKPELAAVLGAERFLHEIKVTANLQHPNILPLYDSGEADSFLYYVMPYVEGETLRGRLKRERQLSVEHAVDIAKDAAAALAFAHGRGVIHRDIKPENVLLGSGQAIVADFGIALAVSTAGGERLTESGVSLGTPHYMSPEQAAGDRELDARSDVYSLACVVYEMLVGDPPHAGSTVQAVVARVLSETPPPISTTRALVPPYVDAAVQRALAKTPADRFASAAQFADALLGRGPVTVAPVRTARAPARQRAFTASMLAVALVTGVGLGLGLSRIIAEGGQAPAPTPRTLDLVLPDSLPVAFLGNAPLGVEQRAFDLSRDGRQLVYVSETTTGTVLVVQDLVRGETRVLAGTEGAFSPTFAPDGRSIAFLSGTELRKVATTGGSPQALASVDDSWGSVWLDSSRIFVAGKLGESPMLIDAFGGRIDSLPQGPVRTGSVTPDRSAMIYSSQHLLRYFDFETRSEWILTSRGRVPSGSVAPPDAFFGFGPTLLPSGHLLYVQQGGAGTLLAVRVEAGTLRPIGSPVQVSANVRYSSQGPAQYAAADDGSVAVAITPGSGRTALVVRSESGSIDSLELPPADYGTFEISPDGGRIAIVTWPVNGLPDLWVYDMARATSERVAQGTSRPPVWTPGVDGMAVLDSGSIGTGTTHTISADGSFLLLQGADGYHLIRRESPQSDGILVPEVTNLTRFSPDGRWIAATSVEGGRAQVYVLATANPDVRHRVSVGGGEEPRWSRDGRRIVFRYGTEWFESSFTNGDPPSIGLPRRLFQGGQYANVLGYSHDLFPDGRYLLLLGPIERTTRRLILLTDLPGLLRDGVNPRR
jgi:serine/threonine-protein kinase